MADRKNRHRPEFVAGLILTVFVIAAYWQVPAFDFIKYDDELYVTENHYINKGLTLEGIVWAFSASYATNWHPITWLSHMLDYELYGLNPMGHHWTSLQIHLANTILLFLVLNWITGAMWPSSFVAALFALHPLNVESVAWIAERKNVLCTFFWILSLWAYVRYTRRPAMLRYGLLIFFYALGLMTKPMLVTLPFILLLLDFWPLCRFNSEKYHCRTTDCYDPVKPVLEKIPLFGLSAISGGITFYVQQSGGAVVSLASLPFTTRIVNALISYPRYLGKMIWPQKLAVFYPYPKWPVRYGVISGLLILCVCVIVVRARTRYPYLFTGWFWYLGSIFPVIGLVHVGSQSIADRYTYIPLIGIFMMIAWGITDISKRLQARNSVLALSASAVLVVLMICTRFQVGYWQNTVTLFTHTLNVTRNNSVAHYVLGLSLEQKGNLDEAMIHYSRSLMLTPDYKTFFRKGYVLYQKGKLDEAMVNYSKSLQMNPNYAEAHNNMGIVLARQGNVNGAINHYHASLKINPNYAGANYNLGQLFDNQGKTDQAVYYYRKALMIEPDMTQALYRQSWIAATHENTKYRDGVKAVELAEKLCKLSDYNEPVALDTLAAAYAEAGKFADAVSVAQKGLQLAELYDRKDLMSGLKKRLKLYQNKRSYRQRQREKAD